MVKQVSANVFYTKTRLPQDLIPDMDVPEKILDMKNANKARKIFFFQNSTKDRMIHFSISVAVKRRRDKYYKAISGTMQRTFEIFVFIHSYPTSIVLWENQCSNPTIT